MFADSMLQFGGTQTQGSTFTNFACNLPGDTGCTTAAPGKGDFSVSSSTGVFAQYNGTFGLIESTNNAQQPLNTAFSLPGFLTFDLNHNSTIELTFLTLGTDTSSTTCASLNHCTPQNNLLITPSDPQGLSGLSLDQMVGGTTATYQVFGIIHQSDGTTDPINGNFTLQFAGQNPQQALASFYSGNTVTYQANLESTLSPNAVTPEPSSVVLTGLGFVGLAGILVIRNGRARSWRFNSKLG